MLKTPLALLAGIGSSLAWKLKNLNLLTIGDLIHHYPFRYDDFSQVEKAFEAKLDEKITLVGEIWSIKNIYTRSHKIMTQAVFSDGTAPIVLTWFNQPWLTKSIQTANRLQIAGKVTKYKNKLSMVSPQWEKVIDSDDGVAPNQKSLHSGRLVPVYPETAGLTSKWLRTKISQVLPEVLNEVEDPLPEKIKNGMLGLSESLQKIHFPTDFKDAEQARDRLGFDELFYIQLATLKTRLEWQKKPTVKPFKINRKKINEFINTLPFKLTNAQHTVANEILTDLQKTCPMNRLVQGEVGSGKTVVAAIAAFTAFLNGYRTLYMAPTEILAFQHYTTLTNLFKPFGVEVGTYTGSRKFTSSSLRAKRSNPEKKIASSPSAPRNDIPNIIVGTHALLSSKLAFDNIGLIIVDEQQRFGVGQRTLLRSKAKVPHFLTMTATPIPRTVALTFYGDLDLSIINQLPKGRKRVRTYVVPQKKRADAYKFIEKKVVENDQVYIITPLIEESETLKSAKAAKVEFERLKTKIFPHLKMGLLHGRLKSKEKEEVMNAFKDKKIDILVSTSVVEVGVDVTNATIMVIEGADRFGLAQLHQLRGRVGRGEKESFCLLFPTSEESVIKNRLKNLEKIYDGLKLSELDLKIRGSGEIFGTRQSGRFELKIARLSDLTLIEKVRESAGRVLEETPTLDKYPKLKVKLAELGTGVMPD